MNADRDSDNQGSMVDFAVQLQVMVIVLLFAALWWFESRLDKIEAKQSLQPAETAKQVEAILEPFLKDRTSWQKVKNEINAHMNP